MPQHPIAYIELPCRNVPALKAFYGPAFGWTFEDFGPDYSAFHDAGVEGGFNGSDHHPPSAPLVVIETADIEAAVKTVEAAGGVITAPVFEYPGGKRFHFTDPAGNELAVMQPDR